MNRDVPSSRKNRRTCSKGSRGRHRRVKLLPSQAMLRPPPETIHGIGAISRISCLSELLHEVLLVLRRAYLGGNLLERRNEPGPQGLRDALQQPVDDRACGRPLSLESVERHTSRKRLHQGIHEGCPLSAQSFPHARNHKVLLLVAQPRHGVHLEAHVYSLAVVLVGLAQHEEDGQAEHDARLRLALARSHAHPREAHNGVEEPALREAKREQL
eukprot:scaffold1253_cov245-Pinguiococcus_pyrenoidosus.AAC.9